MRPRKEFDKGLILIAVIVAVLVTIGIILYIEVRTDAVEQVVEAEGDLHLLLAVHENGALSAVEVVVLNTRTNRGALFDIPANTGTIISTLGRIDRVDTVFDPEAPEPFVGAVEDLLGIDIPFHIILSHEDLSRVVDLAGGLELFLIDPVEQREPLVLIPAGNVLLDGPKALDYIRYEVPQEREIELVARRQRLVQSLLSRWAQQADYLRRPSVLALFRRFVRANLDRQATDSLLGLLATVDSETLIKQRVVGATRTIEAGGEQRELLFPHLEGQWLKSAVTQVKTSIASAEAPTEARSGVRLEILNGTNITGLARRTLDLYEGFGYSAISVGNAETNDVEVTVVIDRVGDGALARQVAEVIRAERIVTRTDSLTDADVTIVLGSDFDGVYVRQ